MIEQPTIMVVDDERGVRESFNMVLKDTNRVLLAKTGREVMETLRKNSVDLILLDIRLPDIDGRELLRTFKETDPLSEVVMVTAVKEIKAAVESIKAGAYEYLIKPFNVDEVLTVIERALEKRRLVREVAYLRGELERYSPFEKMVGKDPKMLDIFDMIHSVAQADGTVLIQGESGTGKELVARAIHNRSPRHAQPFVVVNCAAIPGTLMESELFGHTKGAFTGASQTQAGKLEIANSGTVFLDDINSMDINMQAKLLRVIQEKEFERLGSTKVIHIDSRFVAATNQDLKQLVEEGAFRQDLYYRLNVLPIQLPPLRERKGDIPLLLKHFLEQQAKKFGQASKTITPEAMKLLTGYNWPGNVRELQNLVERLVTIKRGPVIEMDDIPYVQPSLPEFEPMSLKEAVRRFERQYIGQVLDRVNANRTKAAQQLNIHRNTLLSKITDYGFDK